MNANELLKTAYTGTSNTGDLMLCYTMKQIEAIRTALSAPTYEDAIKVVEELRTANTMALNKQRAMGGTFNATAYYLKDEILAGILTDLRERGKKE